MLLCAQHLNRALVAALKPFGLTFAEFDVVNTLRRAGDAEGTHPGALAQASLITTGAMTSRLERLERRGLLTRTPDPTDGRAVRVRLTPAGEDLAEQALHAVLAADERFLEPLSRRQRESLGSMLKLLLLRAEPLQW